MLAARAVMIPWHDGLIGHISEDGVQVVMLPSQ